jgi:hypothetical protein
MKRNILFTVVAVLFITFSQKVFSQCIPNFFMFSNHVECLGNAGVKIHYTQEQWVAHDVYRRSQGDTIWGAPLYPNYWGNPTLYSGSLIKNYFLAADQLPGTTYEYRFTRFVGGGSYSGYIMAGCELPEVISRGNAIMVVANNIADSLSSELETMRKDLIADGYKVTRFDVSQTSTPIEVKNSIRSIYEALNNEKAYLYLIGHVPVPYSGVMMNDDVWEHRGAWPSDVYYADMEGLWTDSIMDWTNAPRDENDNIPGDGKFDTNVLSSKPEFAVGRVDLSNLPCFTELNEIALTRRYFAKDHAFRISSFQTNGGAYIYDLLPFLWGSNPQGTGFTEYYGKIYGNNFPALTDSIYQDYPFFGWYFSGFQNFHNGISSNSYKMSFLGGTAGYTNIDNISTAGQIGTMAGFNSVFNWTYGHYFPDWDNICNFQRMCIAAPGTSLTQIAAANPSHYFHMFGLDRTIGETLLENVWNNNQNYHNLSNPNADNYYRRTHISMMGDPTLRLIYEKLPLNFTVNSVPNSLSFSLSWESNGDSTANYLIFRASSYDNNFVQIGTTAANQTNFIDVSPLTNNNIYLIRARSLCVTGSGSYYNLSPGVFAEFASAFALTSELSDEIICENTNTIGLTYNLSSNLINSSANVICYSNNINQPYYTQSINLSNSATFQFQIPTVLAGTWVKYKTNVTAFSGLETIDSLLVKLKPVAEFSTEILGSTIFATATSNNVDSFQWIVNGNIEGVNQDLSIEINSSNTFIELIVENECGTDTTQRTISITENKFIENSRITVFPNPTKDFLQINNIPPNSKISVIDATGRIITSIKNNNSISEQLQVQDLVIGLYFIKVEKKGTIYTTPFVVKR